MIDEFLSAEIGDLRRIVAGALLVNPSNSVYSSGATAACRRGIPWPSGMTPAL